MVARQGQFKKGSPNRDHRCGVLSVHRQQFSGLGCPLAGINCIWHLVPGPIPATHQCPGASSHMAWPKSVQPESGECKGCSHVRQHVSCCLPEKSGGTKLLPMSDLATDICLWAEKRGNDTNSPSPPLTSECVRGPSVPEGSSPQDRMEPKPDHSRQDISCLGQTIRGSVRPKDKHKTGNVHLPHSGRDGLESGQSCPELGRPVRVCVPPDKSDKGLSKQGQNRRRRDRPDSASLAKSGVVLAIDFPIILPPVQKLLKQSFSHHFPPHPWNLNLHARRLSRDSTRREDFLKRLPRGSLYLRDNPQRGFTNLSGRCSENGARLSKLILLRQLSNS